MNWVILIEASEHLTTLRAKAFHGKLETREALDTQVRMQTFSSHIR